MCVILQRYDMDTFIQVLGVDQKNAIKMCIQRDWTACSKYANHIRFNSQHNWAKGHVWAFNKHTNLHFYNNKAFVWVLEGKWLHAQFHLLVTTHYFLCFTPYKKWMQKENIRSTHVYLFLSYDVMHQVSPHLHCNPSLKTCAFECFGNAPWWDFPDKKV